ncbi:hypothetical protein CVIRNUC_007648 [Coccomyxa viridis]|uniref:Glycosyltransferase family 92 protein n=1 Tax=Coccomyxa viridis TaxID=1274662 RepID=A0AAV1IEL0_9CHLO|nr:hypothetical protein CVIRNUC_007648 [Coccomyxa viridis]
MTSSRPGPLRLRTKLLAVNLSLVLGALASTGNVDTGRSLLARELQSGTFSVFSALHDPLEGLVRVFAEVYPVDVCKSISSCTVAITGAAEETLTVPAIAEVPFINLTAKPELRECFLKCKLPHQGLRLEHVTIESSDGQALATWAVEEVDKLPQGKPKGVGMCVGPIFSSTPTTLDWLQYYAELGVSGIHMYAVVADFVLKPSNYMHEPGSLRALQLEHHRLVTWRAFHPSKWSAHYYGQWLIFNDCVFRTRNVYEYIMFHDRDEFIHFVGYAPKKVHLLSMFARLFGERDVPSITYWGALIHTHCHVEAVGRVGSRRARIGEEVEVQTYSGYDVWEEDLRAPNFTGCTWKTCHPKSVIRPLGVEVMNIHHYHLAAEGFRKEYKMVGPEAVLIKHVRCLLKPVSSVWESDTSKPLCSDEEVLRPNPQYGGMPVCPASTVQEVRARHSVAP